MTKDATPEILKAKAQELLKKAKEIEEKQFIKIGKVVYDYYQKSFEGFELEKFKEEVKKAIEDETKIYIRVTNFICCTGGLTINGTKSTAKLFWLT